ASQVPSSALRGKLSARGRRQTVQSAVPDRGRDARCTTIGNPRMRSMTKPILLAMAAVLLAGCGRDDLIQNAGPELLYERGQEMMQAGNYQGSIQYFLQLEAAYPFSNLTRQA